MHNMDVLIKFTGIVSDHHSSIIYKIAFVWISTLESLVFTCYSNTMSTSGTWNLSYTCTFTKNEPTDPGMSHVGLSNLFLFVYLFVCLFVCFFTWNLINRIKQTFLQINLFVTCSNRARPNSATIDWFVENWEEYSLPSDVMYDCRDGPMDLLLIISVLHAIKVLMAGTFEKNDMSLQGRCCWERDSAGCLRGFVV